MQLTIENYRGIASATVTLSPKITLFAGGTGFGKSSTIQPLQALVSGAKVPFFDDRTGKLMQQKDADHLVHEGTKTGKAELTWDGGKRSIKWPKCELKGDEFKASLYAAGINQPATMPAKDLAGILGILPTKEEFEAEMIFGPEMELPTEAVWKSIEQNGWDKTYTNAVEKGKQLKREWSQIAGCEFLPKNAPSWLPNDYDDRPLPELEKAFEAATKIYEHAIKCEALSEKERQDLEILASAHGDGTAGKAIADLAASLADTNAKLDKAKHAKYEIMKALNPAQAYECWHCGKLGTLKDGKLIEAADPATLKEQTASMQARLAEQEKLIDDLGEKSGDLAVALKEARIHAERCENAHRRLNTLGSQEEPGISVEDARADLELARRKIAAHKAKSECDEIYDAILANDAIQSVLHPDGLRKIVLANKLGGFNQMLAGMCGVAGWPLIQLNEFLGIEWGETKRPYMLLSPGQKWTANAALQIALCETDESEIVILDGADLPDAELLNGLIEVLDRLVIPSVLGFKANSIEKVPNLAAEGLGVAYWCEGGTVKPVAEAVPA